MFGRYIYSKFTILCFFLSFLSLSSLKAQQSFNIAYNYGTILKHSENIKPLIKGQVRGFTINYILPNNSGETWRSYYKFPNYGISYNYKSYGNPDILGDSHSLMGFIQFSFFRRNMRFDSGFKGFSGLGYFTKIYDPVTNPTNQAISAHININAEAHLFLKYYYEPFYLEYSFGLNHFSNGLIKTPNLGLNVLNNTFKLGYNFEKRREKQKQPQKEIIPYKHEFWAFLSTGLKETEAQTKKYVFSSLSFNYSRKISSINKLGIGMDLLNDPSLTFVAYENYHYQGEQNLNFRYGLNVNNEFVLGNTGFFTAYGFYFRKSDYYLSRRYYKVGFKFYFKKITGIVLIRAVPLFRADMVEFGVGYSVFK